MKVTIFLAFTSLLIIWSGGPVHAAALEVLGDENFPPYSFVEGDIVKGIDVEQVREAANRAGLEVSIRLVPFKRMLALIEAGKAPLGFAAFITTGRQAYAHYTTVPLHRSSMSVFARREDGLEYGGLEDLVGKTVLINVGFSISDAFDSHVAANRINVREVRDTRTGIRSLARGKANYYAGNRITTLYRLKLENLLGEIQPLTPPLTEGRGAFLIVSKRADRALELQSAFDQALKAMAADGTIEAIMARYTQ